MKQIKLNYLFTALALVTILASCHKDKVNPKTDNPGADRAGLYVLNQGGLNHNNSTLTYYDYATKMLTSDIFNVANAMQLGDTGNDLGIYGSKMFIAVDKSNVLYVVNSKSAKLIKQITLTEPRNVVFYKSNVFVTSYNGTVSVIDTTTLAITKTITVGHNPEQMVISNGKLYVANSGGFDMTPANTVSVVDLTTLNETKKITVIADPITMATDNYGHVYVMSMGNFNDPTPTPGMTIIDNTTDAVKSQITLPNLSYASPIIVQGDFAYYFTVDGKIAGFNTKMQVAAQANFITDGTVITSPYAITADPLTGEVFVADAKDYSSNGALYAFDKTGKKEYSVVTGINPGKVILVNK